MASDEQLRVYGYTGETPTAERLRQGVILDTIVQAVSTIAAEHYSIRYTWQGTILSLTNYGGARGSIAFTPERIVGAFFYAESERSPLGEETIPPYDAEDYFVVAPPDVLAIARREVLPEMITFLGEERIIDEAMAQGTTEELDDAYFVPVITAAFWSEGAVLTAGEPWQNVLLHGSYLIRRELLDWETALAEWCEEWEQAHAYEPEQLRLVPGRVALIRHLCARRLAAAHLPLRLTAAEYARLTAHGTTQLAPVRQLLAGVGIALPDNPS